VAFEELLQFLYLTPVGIVKFGADGTIDLVNPVASQVLLPLVPEGNLDNLYDSLRPLISDLGELVRSFTGNAGPILDKQRVEAKAGGKNSVLSITVDRVNETVYMAVLRDVTRRAEQERRLFADQQRFRAIFNYVRDYSIYTVTLDGLVEEWNLSLQRFGGWGAADVQGRHIRRGGGCRHCRATSRGGFSHNGSCWQRRQDRVHGQYWCRRPGKQRSA
jgi:PAS domain-containing protein